MPPSNMRRALREDLRHPRSSSVRKRHGARPVVCLTSWRSQVTERPREPVSTYEPSGTSCGRRYARTISARSRRQLSTCGATSISKDTTFELAAMRVRVPRDVDSFLIVYTVLRSLAPRSVARVGLHRRKGRAASSSNDPERSRSYRRWSSLVARPNVEISRGGSRCS
jgi:hypothetical protein